MSPTPAEGAVARSAGTAGLSTVLQAVERSSPHAQMILGVVLFILMVVAFGTERGLIRVSRWPPSAGSNVADDTLGLLLRADLHTLFDLGLVSVDATSMTVIVAPELMKTDCGQLAGKEIALPADNSGKNQHRINTGVSLSNCTFHCVGSVKLASNVDFSCLRVAS
jgi:hypothetical protein